MESAGSTGRNGMGARYRMALMAAAVAVIAYGVGLPIGTIGLSMQGAGEIGIVSTLLDMISAANLAHRSGIEVTRFEMEQYLTVLFAWMIYADPQADHSISPNVGTGTGSTSIPPYIVRKMKYTGAVRSALEALYRTTLDMVVRQHDHIKMVADALLNHGRLTAAEVEFLITGGCPSTEECQSGD